MNTTKVGSIAQTFAYTDLPLQRGLALYFCHRTKVPTVNINNFGSQTILDSNKDQFAFEMYETNAIEWGTMCTLSQFFTIFLYRDIQKCTQGNLYGGFGN